MEAWDFTQEARKRIASAMTMDAYFTNENIMEPLKHWGF